MVDGVLIPKIELRHHLDGLTDLRRALLVVAVAIYTQRLSELERDRYLQRERHHLDEPQRLRD